MTAPLLLAASVAWAFPLQVPAPASQPAPAEAGPASAPVTAADMDDSIIMEPYAGGPLRAVCAAEDQRRVLDTLVGAAQTHPAVTAFDHRARSLEGMGRAEGALKDPTFVVDARGLPLTEPWNLGRTPMGGVQAGVQVTLPWLPRLWAAEEARGLEAEAVRASSGETALDLAEEALGLWVEDDAIVRRLRLLQDKEELLSSLSAVARANASVGMGGQTDAVLLEARAALTRSSRAAWAGQRDALAARWRALVGDVPPPACALDDGASLVEPDPDAARLEGRPRLHALEQTVQAARAKKRAAFHAWVPEPMVQVGYVWRPDYGNFDGIDFVGGMVSVPLPVFPGRRLGPAAAAQAAEEEAGAQREAFLRDAEGARAALLARIDAETRRLDELTHTARPVAEAASEVAQAAYRSGHGNVQDVIEAERMILDIDLERVDAEARRARLRVALWRVMGGVSPTREREVGATPGGGDAEVSRGSR